MNAIVKAAVQISPVLYSRQGTVAKVVTKIRELGEKGVQFATFPETLVPYYPGIQKSRLSAATALVFMRTPRARVRRRRNRSRI